MTSSDDECGSTSMTTTAKPPRTGSPDPIGADDVPALRRRLLVPTLVLAGSLMSVVSSLGAPLIPTLSRIDGVSLSAGEWILTITLLTGALATPVMGRLADGPRQRDVILVALGLVVVGCVVAAVSNGFIVLIVGRGFQGVGLGRLTVALALAALVLPARSAGTSRRFDFVGAGLLSLAVIGVSVVLSEGGGWGWASARSLGVAAVSVVLLAVWIPFELRVAEPLIDLRQVRNRSVLTADASGFLISIAMYLLLPIIVEFVQIPRSAGYGFAASVVVSGLVLIPLSVGSFVASRFLIVYERRFGPRTMIPLGSVVFAVGAMFFALEHSALWEAFVTLAVCGLGIGFTTGAMPGFITRAVAQSETGSATGFYQVVRSIGLTVGSALSAAVLMSHTRHGQSLPDVDGFKVALIIAAGLCVATAVVSFALPGKASSRRNGLTVGGERDLEEVMKDEAELGGTGLIAGDEPIPSGPEEVQP